MHLSQYCLLLSNLLVHIAFTLKDIVLMIMHTASYILPTYIVLIVFTEQCFIAFIRRHCYNDDVYS